MLFGGQSAEHDVSRISARHVLAAVDPDRYEVQPVGITKDGEWLLATETARALAAGAESLPDALPVTGDRVDPSAAVAPRDQEPVVVFPILHGPMGEDGTVQGLLEVVGVPYVGCGVLASALAMDKAKAKEVLAAAGIPQARFAAIHAADLDDTVAERVAHELGLPVFVKPANMGSSIGVTKAHDLAGLRAAIGHAASFDEWIVCEEAISGRELEVAVLGNHEPRASVPGEIEPGAEFYDYDDKYVDGRAKLLIPAPLSDEECTRMQQLALATYAALRCEGMARVDFFYEEGGRGFLVNEVNTIPGFTPISMYPQLWQASGLDYAGLIDELVALALERHQRRRRRVDPGPATPLT